MKGSIAQQVEQETEDFRVDGSTPSRPTTPIKSREFDGYMRELWPKACEACGNIFYVPKYRLEKRRTCSAKCRDMLAQNQVELKCAWCRKAFTRAESKVRETSSGLHFCQRSCKDRAQREDGLSEVRPLKADPAGYRVKALRLKPKKCEGCGYGDEVGMLDVHHIDGDRKNNEAENLKILCVWCHALKTRKVSFHPWDGEIGPPIEEVGGAVTSPWV